LFRSGVSESKKGRGRALVITQVKKARSGSE
jgi:hypothetical protein